MKIVFLGKVLLSSLSKCWRFDRTFPKEQWGFPLGSEMVKEFVRIGHDVHVVMEYPVQDMEVYKSAECVVWLVPESSSTKRQFLTLFKREVAGMRYAIERIQPDVVFAQWTYYNAYAGVTSAYPTLVVAHDSPWRVLWVFRNLRMLIRAFYAQIFVLPKVKNLTAVSPHIVSDLCLFNRYKKHIRMIPNGISISANRPLKFVEPSVPAKTIVMVSQWGRLKNSKTMFRAFVKLRKRHQDWRLIVYGGYMDERGAGKWLEEVCLPIDGIELRGLRPQDEIRNTLLSEADIFVSPSLEESFGMVFIEAMSVGVPCVGGRNSGAVPWVLGEGTAGVLADVHNVDSLAESIEKLMLDGLERKRLSIAGIQRVEAKFNIKHVMRQYEIALKEILK